MKIEIEQYRVQRPVIAEWLRRRPDVDLVQEIAEIAISTNCPVIIVAEYIMEIKGRTEALVEAQNSFMRFYGVTELV